MEPSPHTGLSAEHVQASIHLDPPPTPVADAELEQQLRKLPGLDMLRIEAGCVTASYDPLQVSEKEIEQAIRAAGRKPRGAEMERETPY